MGLLFLLDVCLIFIHNVLFPTVWCQKCTQTFAKHNSNYITNIIHQVVRCLIS